MKTILVLVAALGGLGAAQARLPQNSERVLIAYMEVKAGTEPDFLRSAQRVIEESRKETGNIRYQLHQSVAHPQQFVFYEFFKSDGDLQYHRYSPHVLAFLKQTKPITLKFTLEEYIPQGDLQ